MNEFSDSFNAAKPVSLGNRAYRCSLPALIEPFVQCEGKGMGGLPLGFKGAEGIDAWRINRAETLSAKGLGEKLKLEQAVIWKSESSNRSVNTAELTVRIDAAVEKNVTGNGGILPYVLRRITK